MPVLTSMPEVAQAWRAWLEDMEEEAIAMPLCQEHRVHVGSVLCLMQILVNRHHMTFTFLHAKLFGEFVKDHLPIAEIRQIFMRSQSTLRRISWHQRCCEDEHAQQVPNIVLKLMKVNSDSQPIVPCRK